MPGRVGAAGGALLCILKHLLVYGMVPVTIPNMFADEGYHTIILCSDNRQYYF